jgi:hypothetical protein
MATKLQDLQAKRKELQATNPNATMLDAKSALSPIANAPVAWQAPAITPITPAPTAPIDNKQVLANNQAKVAWEIANGTRPAVWQQSESLAPPTWTTTPSGATLNADWTVTNAPPVNQATPPVTPTNPVTNNVTPSPTSTPKGWEVIDYNQGAWREADISKNLTGFKQQWMDDNAIKQASGYATADATKKAQIDWFLAWQNKPLDSKTILNGMIAWTPPVVQNTPEYRTAKANYDQFQKFNSMSAPQLLDNLKQNQVTTEMNSLLATNPNYIQAKQQFETFQKVQWINSMVNGMWNGMNGKEIETPDYLQALSDKILAKLGLSDTTNQEAFKQIVTQDPKVVQYANDLSAINRQVADTTKLLNDGYKDLKAQYGDMPSSAIITLMNSRFSEANNTLTNLNNSKSYLEADLKNAVEMAQGEYQAAQADIQNSTALRNSVLGQAIWAEFDMAQKQMEAEMVKKAQQEALNDPATAINNVMEEYKKYWVIPWKSSQSYLSDAKDYIAQWGTLEGYLNKMISELQSNESFKSYQAKQTGTEWQSANITRYNPSTWANESTPIFYRKKTNWDGWFEAVDLSGNPIDANILSGTGTWMWASTPWAYSTSTTEMRTDRNMNPTAFTTDIAKQAWLVEWVDYVVGDKFPWSSNLYTAKLIWDPIETSIRVIDSIWFKTKWGANRWTYTDKLWLNNDTWSKMSPTDKATAIKKMYQQEWWNGKAIWDQKTEWPSGFSASEVKAFESYDWKTIPEQYKTPLQKQEFLNAYNWWRNSQGWNVIKTWEDILKINLWDKATEWQKSAITYSARMLNALESIKSSQVEQDFAKLPFAQQATQYYLLPDIAKSQNQKEYDAYKLDFITSVLRKESGAAIWKDEYVREEKKYFPQPWDDETVLTAKQNARNFRVKALLSEAWKDVNWKLASSYYNPEAIKNDKEEKVVDYKARIQAIRDKANQK